MTGRQLGKEPILDAAARLFDERGVDGVSLTEITNASGHRNRSATAYHFGGKEEIVRALVRRSMGPADARRSALLDELLADDPTPPAEAVVRIALLPMVEQLGDPAGRRYVRLIGQLVGHPRWYTATESAPMVNASLARCAVLVAGEAAHLPEERRPERRAQVTGFITRALAEQAALLDDATPSRRPLEAEAFLDELVALVLAILRAPAGDRSAAGSS